MDFPFKDRHRTLGSPRAGSTRTRVPWLAWVAFLLLALAPSDATAAPLPRLHVSDNQRFLVTADGHPFFWQGDTAWELFHRLDRKDAESYLRTRASQRFNVVQAVVLAELDGLSEPNANGDRPLSDNDPLRPVEKYFDHVEAVVRMANDLGIYVGLLPTWGDKWNKKWGVGPEIFNTNNAAAYGEWLGRRFRDAGIVWIVGGDRPVESDHHKAIIRSMALGLRRGDGGAHLITFHPTGGAGSSKDFHGEAWLDFNMRQNGHSAEHTGRYSLTRDDHGRTPTKPVIDGEPLYEGHPLAFDAAKQGHSVAADVRPPLYWDLFEGAFGHTYGHHSVWQMWTPSKKPVNAPLMPWAEALQEPGARQMQHGRALIESRPFLSRVPAPEIIVPERVETSVPGAGRGRFVATRDTEGTYGMVYVPVGRPFTVRLDFLRGDRAKAWWFDPRTGKARGAGTFPAQGERTFASPTPGERMDWVLVLDDPGAGYGAPGSGVRPR